MALPIFPILAVVAVVMFAGGAGKKAGRRAGTTGPSQLRKTKRMLQGGATVFIPMGVPDPVDDPVFGAICGPASERDAGVWSAYAQNGECFVFWDQDTDVAMTYYIQQAFEESGYSLEEVCAPAPGWEGDPFDPDPASSAAWIPNQIQIALLKKALATSYPQIPADMLPPPEVLGPQDVGVEDYVQVVWVFALSILLREVCGYMPVT